MAASKGNVPTTKIAKAMVPPASETISTVVQTTSTIEPIVPAPAQPAVASTAVIPADAPVLVKNLVDYFASRMSVLQPDKMPQLVDLLNEKNRQIEQITGQLAVDGNSAMIARHQALADTLQKDAAAIANLIGTLVQGQKIS